MKVLLLLFLMSCGSESLFSDTEEAEPNYAAARALELDEPDKAIEIMEKALESEPNNYNYISILASAKAQKAGVDLLTLVLKLAESDGSGTGSNEIELMFGILPKPSLQAGGNIEYLGAAISHMQSIPTSNKTPADIVKLTVFYTAMSALQTKIFDADGDGDLSTGELQNLTVAEAAAIIANIGNAAAAIGSYVGEGNEALAAEKIDEIQNAINAEGGGNSADQLRNYLDNT